VDNFPVFKTKYPVENLAQKAAEKIIA